MKNNDGLGHSGPATDLAYAIGSGALLRVDPSGELERLGAYMLLATAKDHPMIRHVIDGVSIEGMIEALHGLVEKGTLTKDGFTARAELGRWN